MGRQDACSRCMGKQTGKLIFLNLFIRATGWALEVCNSYGYRIFHPFIWSERLIFWLLSGTECAYSTETRQASENATQRSYVPLQLAHIHIGVTSREIQTQCAVLQLWDGVRFECNKTKHLLGSDWAQLLSGTWSTLKHYILNAKTITMCECKYYDNESLTRHSLLEVRNSTWEHKKQFKPRAQLITNSPSIVPSRWEDLIIYLRPLNDAHCCVRLLSWPCLLMATPPLIHSRLQKQSVKLHF